MPEKGTRRIVVEGTSYRWRTTRSGPGSPVDQPLAAVVESAEHPRSPLRVTFGDRSPVGYCCPPCMALAAEAEPVTPGRVATAVRRALTEGWDPRGRSGVFRLDQRAHRDS